MHPVMTVTAIMSAEEAGTSGLTRHPMFRVRLPRGRVGKKKAIATRRPSACFQADGVFEIEDSASAPEPPPCRASYRYRRE